MLQEIKQQKVAFVHEWLIEAGGSEKLLAAMIASFPNVPIYTLFHDSEGPTVSLVQGHPVTTSFLQKIPGALRRYRSLLPLMPFAIEQFDLSDYDIIISNSHAVAKGVLTGPDQLHINMNCSPVRYAWDLQHQYLRESNKDKGLQSWVARWILHEIRKWDYRTANGVDHFIAISNFIARRIWKVYRREATVIYPPVSVDDFPLQEEKENFYLTASRMVPYKKINLIVETFSEMPDKQLIVIGTGPDFEKIKKKAGPNIRLLGYQPFDVLKEKMQKAKAFVFAAEEDFGIVPVEAQACGTPVIAYGKGGALETVIKDETGIFFDEQTVNSLKDAVERFEHREEPWNPQNIRQNAERFSKERFQQEFQAFVQQAWQKFQNEKSRL